MQLRAPVRAATQTPAEFEAMAARMHSPSKGGIRERPDKPPKLRTKKDTSVPPPVYRTPLGSEPLPPKTFQALLLINADLTTEIATLRENYTALLAQGDKKIQTLEDEIRRMQGQSRALSGLVRANN